MITNPSELNWIEGELPDVHSVSYDSYYLVMLVHDYTQEQWMRENILHIKLNATFEELNGTLRRITMVRPYVNALNPLRWCDSQMPIGYTEKVTWYARIQ